MVRALGVSLGYGHSYFGGAAPLIYEAFKEHGQVMWFIVYVTTLTFISTPIYIFGLKISTTSRDTPRLTTRVRLPSHKTGTAR